MSERRTAILGAALVAIGPITMALYTPAMPVLAEVFSTSSSMVKLTLTAYFTGFALTQLVCGPLTDAFGRKSVTLVFLMLYLASTVMAAFAPTIEWMLVARTMQGIGASVGVAVSRAIVRDQFTGQTSARIMNAIAMMLAIGPALAPSIGGVTLELFGWREIFWAMLVYGVVLVFGILVFLRETNAYIDPSNLKPGVLLRNYLMLLIDPRFLQPSLLVGLGIGTIYTLATILPFVLIEQVGLTPTQFGFGMMIQSGSFITGAIVTSRLLKRMDAEALLPFSLSCMVLSGLAMILLLSLAEPRFLTGFPRLAGSASSMMGFMQFGAGLAGSLVAAGLGDPLVGLTVVPPTMLFLAVGSYVGLGRYNRRRRAVAG
eukprot:jgi/Tetstr1/431527/TSEL_002179.t1